jgi:hypothetical protein
VNERLYLHCTCKQPYSSDRYWLLKHWCHLFARFMIGCDYCGEWFHGSCVGVT